MTGIRYQSSRSEPDVLNDLGSLVLECPYTRHSLVRRLVKLTGSIERFVI